MHTSRFKRFVSYVLIAGAAVLLFLGAREFLGSRFGQIKSARDFNQEISKPATVPSTPKTRAPERGDMRMLLAR